mgnify:CR=1 FL=1
MNPWLWHSFMHCQSVLRILFNCALACNAPNAIPINTANTINAGFIFTSRCLIINLWINNAPLCNRLQGNNHLFLARRKRTSAQRLMAFALHDLFFAAEVIEPRREATSFRDGVIVPQQWGHLSVFIFLWSHANDGNVKIWVVFFLIPSSVWIRK